MVAKLVHRLLVLVTGAFMVATMISSAHDLADDSGPRNTLADHYPRERAQPACREGSGPTSLAAGHSVLERVQRREQFVGAALFPDCIRIFLHGKPTAETLRGVRRSDLPAVTFYDVPRSIGELHAIQGDVARYVADTPVLADNVVGFWPDFEVGVVAVAIVNATAADEAGFRARFGDTVEVRSVPPTARPRLI